MEWEGGEGEEGPLLGRWISRGAAAGGGAAGKAPQQPARIRVNVTFMVKADRGGCLHLSVNVTMKGVGNMNQSQILNH